MPPKEFAITSVPAPSPEERLSFNITVYADDGEVRRKELFGVLDYVPLLPFVLLNAALDAGGTIRGNAAADQFIRSMLEPGDEIRWATLLADKGLRIDAEDIKPIVEWLVEVVSDRPSSGPSDSPDGPMPNGHTSTAAAPSVE